MGLDDEDKVKLSAACCCCILIPSVIIQIGLEYNGVALTLDPETVNNGRYFVGLGHFFLKFPAKLQYIEFSNSADGGERNTRINLWTKDGQEVFAEVGFYYQIIPEHLADLYYLYGHDYLEVIENIATNAFRDVSTQYDTIQFFEERDTINDEMHRELQQRLLSSTYVRVPRFNLLSLDMPDRFETAIVDKVIKEQEKKTLEFTQISAVISEEIALEQAKADKDIAILNAQATANGTVITEAAKAAAFETVQMGVADLRLELAQALGLNGTAPTSSYEKLLHYMYLDLVRGSTSNAELLFNINKLLVSGSN